MAKKQNKKVMSGHRDVIEDAVGRLYDKTAPMLIGEALLFGVVALLMAFKPLAVFATLVLAIGVGLVLFGLWRTVSGFVKSYKYGIGGMDIVFGLTNVVLGVLFCVFPSASMITLLYIFLALFLVKAIKSLIFAIHMARARFGHWGGDLFVAIILCVLAGALLFWPLAGAVAVVYYLAITLLMYAAADVYMVIELHRLKEAVDD